jgi:adenine-specific DNA-methyltransferase
MVDENGNITQAIDFDILKQELSTVIVEGNDERYQFSWPDKRKSILLANAPIAKTLRPFREESLDFDSTENLYIEGDNLDILKLLQETYLGKVKMIYIDPPYNTGNDFVYEDKFALSTDDYFEYSGQFSDEGYRLEKNLDTSGRFHTDWLNMLYPRLKVAKDLLSEDGVIFTSIDDNEQANMLKMLNEIFGEGNKIAEFMVIRAEGGGLAKQVIKGHDYLFAFAKDINQFSPLGRKKDIRGKIITRNDEEYWIQEDWLRKEFGKYGNCHYEEILIYKDEKTKLEIDAKLEDGEYVLIPKSNGMHVVGKLRKINEDASKFYSVLKHLSANGIKDLRALELDQHFDYPKPVSLLKELILGATFFTSKSGDIILDFFSGSATTAHAVLQLNAEDDGNRRFIMIQLSEETDENSDAFKAGYKNICEIGKERIRRAGAKIKEGSPLTTKNLDVGFRVLKLDSTNMKDVYYNPESYDLDMLDLLTDNIKEDRTPEDLLFQVMLDLGVLLSSKIEESEIAGKKVFDVADGFLIACFDHDVNEETIKEIAQKKPYYFVMRDSSMADDSVATNFDQLFAAYSPDTIRRVL